MALWSACTPATRTSPMWPSGTLSRDRRIRRTAIPTPPPSSWYWRAVADAFRVTKAPPDLIRAGQVLIIPRGVIRGIRNTGTEQLPYVAASNRWLPARAGGRADGQIHGPAAPTRRVSRLRPSRYREKQPIDIPPFGRKRRKKRERKKTMLTMHDIKGVMAMPQLPAWRGVSTGATPIPSTWRRPPG